MEPLYSHDKFEEPPTPLGQEFAQRINEALKPIFDEAFALDISMRDLESLAIGEVMMLTSINILLAGKKYKKP